MSGIVTKRQQTVFMITHDIDEAILRADRILLMTNGPNARVSESFEITIPLPLSRDEIVEHPNYYAIRNHLVHFLASRSADMAGKPGEATPPIETVHIDRTAPAAVSGVSDSAAEAPLRAVND